MSSSKVVWSVKEFCGVLRKRQLNKFDCNMGVSGRRGDGKTQVKGNKVLMSDGEWKNVEDVKIGDVVISPQQDGSFTYEKVIETHSRFEDEIYDICEVTRSKRILYSCAWNHDIVCFDSLNRGVKNIEAEKVANRKRNYSFSSPCVEFKKDDAKIDPYCLGVHIGDGYSSKSGIRWSFNSKKSPCIKYFIKKYPNDVISTKKRVNNNYRHFIKHRGKFSNEIRDYGLYLKKSKSKFIPVKCLLSSIDYRFNLLAGLIDTDGTVHKNNIIYTTISKQLSEDIKKLVFSLGGRARIQKKKINDNEYLFYNVLIAFEDNRIIPLKVKHKKEGLHKKIVNPRNIAIKSVKRNYGSMVYGFSLTGNSKWYITNNYMVTHNSTLLFKIFNSFKEDGFDMNKHMEYSQQAVTNLLANQRFGFCWDDEAINSGYKRDFQVKGQKILIKVVTNYRDNYNIYASALPFFYSLDTDLRALIFVHIHIIERGVGVILLPLDNQIHASDPWDTKNNIKIEERESRRVKRNPDLPFRYNKLTTFAGYIYFGPMTKKQEKKYKGIKATKRSKNFGLENESEKLDFKERCYKLLIAGKLSNDGLLQACLLEDRQYSSMTAELNRMLKNNGETKTARHFFKEDPKSVLHNKLKGAISNLVPSPSV